MSEKLKAYVERIMGHEGEKKEISELISEAYKEAKSDGYDPKVLRLVIKLLKMPASDRENQDAMVETYLREYGVKQ